MLRFVSGCGEEYEVGSGEDEFMVGGERIRGRIWAVGFVMFGVPSPV